jgi:hypothetical protein
MGNPNSFLATYNSCSEAYRFGAGREQWSFGLLDGWADFRDFVILIDVSNSDYLPSLAVPLGGLPATIPEPNPVVPFGSHTGTLLTIVLENPHPWRNEAVTRDCRLPSPAAI